MENSKVIALTQSNNSRIFSDIKIRQQELIEYASRKHLSIFISMLYPKLTAQNVNKHSLNYRLCS